MLCDIIVNDKQMALDAKKNTIPPDILVTNQRPDLTIIDREAKQLVILELSIPFETNLHAARERKADRYAPLLAGLDERGYTIQYFSLEVGSRGIAAQNTFKTLKRITGAPRRKVQDFMKTVIQTVINCSYMIFKAKDCDDSKFDFIIT